MLLLARCISISTGTSLAILYIVRPQFKSDCCVTMYFYPKNNNVISVNY